MKKRIKINGFIIFVAMLLAAFFPSFFFRHNPNLFPDGFMEIFGIALILLGQIFRVSARGYKAEHSQNGHSLIRGGPYKLARNPMYLGILLIGLGVVLLLFEWWTISIFLVFFIIRYVLLIFKEEKQLLILFPKEYRDYCAQVPRILPSLNTLFNKDISEYFPLKLSWLKREIGPIFTVLFIALFLESWEDIKAEGIRAYIDEVMFTGATIILFIGLVAYLSKRTLTLERNAADKSKSN